MTRKQLIALVVVLALLAGIGAGIWTAQRTAWNAGDSRVGTRLLPGLKFDDVAEIALRDGAASTTLMRSEGKWLVKERADFQADAERVREFLLKLSELKIVQTEPIVASQRPRLDLVEPALGGTAGTTTGTTTGTAAGANPGAGTSLDLKDKAGKALFHVLLGKKVTTRSAGADAGAEQGTPTGRYILSGTVQDTAVLVSDPLQAADPKADAWLFKDLVRAERIQSVTATGPDGKVRYTVSREGEGLGWKLAGGEQPDLQKAQDIASAFQSLSLIDVVADAAAAGAAMQGAITVKAQTLDGLTYTMRIGAKSGEDRYHLTISVAGEPPAARTPAKDETAEQKEKLDKSFAEGRTRMMERLAHERALERWTYLVARAGVEPLLRERAQLLPEKKPKDAKKP